MIFVNNKHCKYLHISQSIITFPIYSIVIMQFIKHSLSVHFSFKNLSLLVVNSLPFTP